ncbi:uncharacterized protein LOC143891810 [Tasmannia lanceolata]|uniref:uncharacterized protein LOC143891810 n=1 Tax=Tasmannia lanceolata TaxID=3420 RepID=UPI0040632FCB
MDMSLSFLPCHQQLTIVDCCNGLLLCMRLGIFEYIVCNPAIRKWVSLPCFRKIAGAVGLVYDPQISEHFKVINFFDCTQEASSIELEIFSSETGKWVESTLFLGSEYFLVYGRRAVFSNGALHVLFYQDVLKFDIKEGICRMIELPEPLYFSTGCLGESGGCLHYP